MSADSTSYIIKKQSNSLKLTLKKDPRIKGISKTPPSKEHKSGLLTQQSTSPTANPIVVPAIPKLLPLITSPKAHPQIEHYFTTSRPPTSSSCTTTSTLLSPSRQLHSTNALSSSGKKSPKVKEQALWPREPVTHREGSTDADNEDTTPPKSKKSKTVHSGGLPPNRVKTIMKTNIQSHQSSLNISQESLAVVTKATVSTYLYFNPQPSSHDVFHPCIHQEMFIAEIAKRSCNTAREQSNKDVTYSHIGKLTQWL